MIKVQNLSKIYKLYNQPQDRLKEALHPLRKKYHHDFYALKGLNFEIKKGETVGIIGKNGSGKSTLLKILTGVLTPSDGTYEVGGKISSLLELGAGFNPELSGLENVYFNGSVLGFTKEEMESKVEDIITFADIGEFIHQPVKTYSSGMYVRLAFAVAINVDPDILIIDEALSVGDIRFQLKCFRKFREFQEAGKTILFVTHDTGAVMNYCSRAIWLDDGGIKEIGDPENVCKKYSSFMVYDAETKTPNLSTSDEGEMSKGQRGLNKKTESIENKISPFQDVSNCESFGEGGAEITGVAFYDPKTMEPLKILEGGEDVCLAIKVVAKEDIENFIFGFMINDSHGNHITGMNTYLLKEEINVKKDDEMIVKFSFNLPKLKNNNYTVTTSVAEGTQENHLQHHWLNDSHIFQVVSKREIARLDIMLDMDKIDFDMKQTN